MGFSKKYLSIKIKPLARHLNYRAINFCNTNIGKPTHGSCIMMGVIKKTDNVTYTSFNVDMTIPAALNYKIGATISNFKLCCSVEVEMKHLMGIVTGSSTAGFALVIGLK